MAFLLFHDLTDAESAGLLALVCAREPARLRELGEWVAATDGPVDALDASWHSLVPLWKWVVEFIDADLPGVPRDAQPVDCVDEPANPALPLALPLLYVVESVAHYLAATAQRAHPDVCWTVWPRAGRLRMAAEGEPCLELQGHHFRPYAQLRGLAVRVRPELCDRTGRIPTGPQYREPGFLLDLLTDWLPPGLSWPEQEPGPSVLLGPPAEVDLPAWDPRPAHERQQLARAMPAPRSAPVEDGLPDDECLIYRGPRSVVEARLGRLKPLDERLLLQLVNRLAVAEGEPEAQALPMHDNGDVDTVLIAGAAIVQIHGARHRGTLRVISIDPVEGIATKDGRTLMRQFKELADQMNAKLELSDMA